MTLLRIYVIFVILLGLGVLIFLSFNLDISQWGLILLWAVILILAELIPVRVPQIEAVLSIDSAIFLATILLFGPGVTSWFGILSAVFCDGIIRKVPFYKSGFNGAQVVLAFGGAGTIYYAVGGVRLLPSLPESFDIIRQILLPLVLCVIVYFVINSFSVSIAIGLQKKIPPLRIWRSHFRWTIFSNIALVAPLGLLMAFIQIKIGIWAVFYCFLPLLFFHYSLKSYTELQEEHLAAIAALCSAQDASDQYTYGHSERVSKFAEKIARQLRLPDREVETIRYAGQLHDIGKIGIDYKIVQKPGPLNLREWAEIKKHPAIGAEILRNLKFLKKATPYVELHHERLDGGGYPLGKTADDIPLGARIIKVADSFDAMTSERAYRPAMTIEQTLEQLEKDSGDQYDPSVVEALKELISKGEINVTKELFPAGTQKYFETNVV
ncbi:MAG: HD-GYP domain-containing protein [Gemmatimonadota bacterium]|nr:MAG: HD-GYP domain-containing protein [Gemmatimonadota bacterium]